MYNRALGNIAVGFVTDRESERAFHWQLPCPEKSHAHANGLAVVLSIQQIYFRRRTTRRKSGQNSLAMLFRAADSSCAPQLVAVWRAPRSAGG